MQTKINKTLIGSVANALQKPLPVWVRYNKSWQFLHQEYNIGTPQGTKLKLTARDKTELIHIIQLEAGINLNTTSIQQFKNMHREQAISQSQHEKWAGKAVKQQRLALKTLAGQPLDINQQHYNLPPSGHIDISLEDLTAIAHNCILMVENYRCFDQLQQINLKLPPAYQQPLVVYRGDNYYSERSVRTLLDQFALPVIALFDIDLKSLLLAAALPNIIGLMCIDPTELSAALANKGNAELYAKQLPSCRIPLNNNTEPVIQCLWKLLQNQQKVWLQEHDLNMEHSLTLLTFGC